MNLHFMNKSLCLAPWNHIQINAEGIVNPCCMFYPTEYHKKYNNLQEAFDGSENKDLRQRMLNGEKIEGCSKCDLYESMNKFSYREHFNRKYAIEDDIQVIDAPSIKNPKIRELEFALDNTCNFKCVTCSSRFSSKWYEDDLELIKEGISRHSQAIKNKTQILRNVNNLDDLDLSELNYLKLIGGEPFINDRYVDILKKLNLENLDLALITNNSVFPKKWIEYILKVKQLNLHISIDGVYDVGEFVRNGMNFEKFHKNLIQWKKLSEEHDHIDIKFNFVVHSLNILNLKSTVDYLISLGFVINVDHVKEEIFEVDFLKDPEYINLSYLPVRTKKFVEGQLNFSLNGKRDMIVDFMYSNDHDKSIMEKFLKYCMFLEQRKPLPAQCEFMVSNAF